MKAGYLCNLLFINGIAKFNYALHLLQTKQTIMKLLKPTLILGVILFAFDAFSQNILIADNRPSRPLGAHVYIGLQEAIDAATDGDIIHLMPSAINYGNVTVNKELTIYGIGFSPDKDGPQKAWVDNMSLVDGASNTRVSGINISTALYIGNSIGANYSVSNVFVENSRIKRILRNTSYTVSFSNVVIRNCIIGWGYTSSAAVMELDNSGGYTLSNVLITNNIITPSTYGSGQYAALRVDDAIIKNNLFLGDNNLSTSANGWGITQSNSCTVSNNIFYGVRAYTGTVTNTTFNNNLSNLPATDGGDGYFNDFATGAGSGTTYSGNITATDPLFTNVGFVYGWDFAYDPTTSAAEVTSGGTDGTDIGLFGSTIPFSMTGTPLPIIKTLIIPEIIKQGNNLNADIEAVGN